MKISTSSTAATQGLSPPFKPQVNKNGGNNSTATIAVDIDSLLSSNHFDRPSSDSQGTINEDGPSARLLLPTTRQENLISQNNRNKTMNRRQRSELAKFFIYSGATIFFFIINGICTEQLFRIPGFQPFGFYLTFFQFCLYTSLSFVKLRGSRKPVITSSASTGVFALLGFLGVLTSSLSNASVGFMNYPTQLMFKSCKVIPVMIGGIFIQGKRYGILEFGSMIMMSIGLVFFSLADSAVSPRFQTKGLIMVSLALCVDAVIGNVQEKIMMKYSISNDELIFRSYSLGSLFLLAVLILTGELFQAFSFCAGEPMLIYSSMFAFSLSAYCGFNCVLLLIKNFGAVTTVTVTTLRKSITLCLSFIFFAKPFVFQYVWSGMLVIGGIYVNMCAKRGRPVDPFLTPLIQYCLRGFQLAVLKRQTHAKYESKSYSL